MRLRAGGLSLWPLLPPGVTLVLAAPPPGHPRPGDLLAVELRGHVVCHLCVAVDPPPAGTLHTRGPWLLQDDPPLPPEALVALVTHARLAGRDVPLAGPAFRAWTRAALAAAPVLRHLRAGLASRLPSALRRRLHAWLSDAR